ncbi:aspartyl-phosphate phosphatase Spo0E family protein [Clostridium drakei]|uniref:Spo0E family sporulation regulatory protein-aspartic acid phosphatase n=1 Tax=Clostridium drakei TaxID=332101 RepID=A0A2U8DVA9_9CLOT|nr:aspartyl-phosphate phosphatase Spo0E family protein [Clostridium drakei]AWI06560.1 Spo0E family sporulation regulatory protein-aspartic acid phosphatase [Clostridium drakei]
MKNIQKYEYLLTEIDNMRKYMYVIIERGVGLTDDEMLEISQRIDSLLNDYNKLIHNKNAQVA